MGSRAKRKSKHKKNSNKSESENLHREISEHDSSNTVGLSNFEPRRSSCCSDINLVFRPKSIISQHDFEADPTRIIRMSRDLGTRSDELETLLFQSCVDEFMKSPKKVGRDSKINTTFFSILLTEIEKIKQDLLQRIAFINSCSCVLSGSYQQPNHPDHPEEPSNLAPITNSHQMDEQVTKEQMAKEILTYRPSENISIESRKEKHRDESSDKPLIQDCHEKQEFDDTLGLVVDSGSEEGATHDKGIQVTKTKRKRAKRKRKKKRASEDESNKISSVTISGTNLNIDVTKEESELMKVLNYYTERSLTLTDDNDLYIIFVEYHFFILCMFKQSPNVMASLISKFEVINSPKKEVHEIKDKKHHFVQSVFYCILLGRLKSGTDKLQEYFNSLTDDIKSQRSHDILLNESNDTIISYFRIVAENGNMHPVVWYMSLRELARNIEKSRPFPGPKQACNHWKNGIRHWTDVILHCTCCDECLPHDEHTELLVTEFLKGSEVYRDDALKFWKGIRCLPWINAVATFNFNKIMGL
ncbi:hypothetical protein OnM2_082032 [Erysiphe neolycopersici]|uniref:Uncharacterized protein n=1 Tax=Erysiphe neolycopersici TaxID=212602 RepID=A0A420HFM7_9PEZI|nr:hypothetical protein OnM2_082032 [Erysiphe neolycopersici]